MRALGERIEKYRLLKNITQDALAEDAGIGVRTLRRVESGESGTIDTLLRILNALKLPVGLEDLIPDHNVRPIERARQTKKERIRATTSRGKDSLDSGRGHYHTKGAPSGSRGGGIPPKG
jgi:transcriptional regulator with XRE-family HTH domain